MHPGSTAKAAPGAAREQLLFSLEADPRQPVLDRRPSPLVISTKRVPGLLLDQGATVSDPAAGSEVFDLQATKSQRGIFC
jgi:hypothetical protein